MINLSIAIKNPSKFLQSVKILRKKNLVVFLTVMTFFQSNWNFVASIAILSQLWLFHNCDLF